jgi:hypothetical protein
MRLALGTPPSLSLALAPDTPPFAAGRVAMDQGLAAFACFLYSQDN